MIRTDGEYLQVHFGGGNTFENFSLANDSVVYKLEFNSSGVTVTNLYTMQTESITNSDERGMGSCMFSFVAYCDSPGYIRGDETNLDAFYGIAGVKRATTSEEDEYFKNMLLTQGV